MEAIKRDERIYVDKTIFSSDVQVELLDIKNKIIPVCDTINNTMNLVLDKKELKKWFEEIKTINDEINLGYKKQIQETR